MPYQLPATIVKKQLHYDLIGKDSQRGITLSYGWLANQCGHCMLGFIPVHLLYLLLSKVLHVSGASWKAALFIVLFWTAFEIYNVVKPLSQQKKEGALFEPDWKILFMIPLLISVFLQPELYWRVCCWGLTGTYSSPCYWWLLYFLRLRNTGIIPKYFNRLLNIPSSSG